MTPHNLINDMHQKYAEWIEMQDDPSAFVAEVLAKKVIALEMYIEYLEKRVDHVSTK